MAPYDFSQGAMMLLSKFLELSYGKKLFSSKMATMQLFPHKRSFSLKK